MTFDKVMTVILELEGGDKVVEDPRDPGGLTRWGIALNANPELGREGILNLTRAKAVKIYREKYWLPGKVSSFPARLRLAIMDGHVNHGIQGNSRIIQKAANAMGQSLLVDGVIGPKTLAAVRLLDAGQFLLHYLEQRQALYRGLPAYDRFGRGWERRVLTVAIAS
jgi:lysozyme family protein